MSLWEYGGNIEYGICKAGLKTEAKVSTTGAIENC